MNLEFLRDLKRKLEAGEDCRVKRSLLARIEEHIRIAERKEAWKGAKNIL